MTRSRFVVVLLAVASVVSACSSGSESASAAHSRSPTTRPGPTSTSAPRATTDPLTGAGPGVDVYAHTHAGMLAPAVANDPPRVYVPNTLSNTVDVIDPTTLKVIDHFAVGDTPQHVVPSYDLSTLYVNNNKGNSLTPIDPRHGPAGRTDPRRRSVQPLLHPRRRRAPS